MIVRVFVIGGSDSGGGAGIQADVKTITALGAYAASAVTAITAQNTTGVHRSQPVEASLVRAQIAAVLDDIGADAVKVGMLPTPDVVTAVADALASSIGRSPLVVDPVAYAGTGATLSPDAAREVSKAVLLPRAALITPNVPEAELLGARRIDDERGLRDAAQKLLLLGPGAVLVKGGHIEGASVTDVLATADGDVHVFTSPRIETRAGHGTGCTLASAIAVGLAEGCTLRDAVERGRDYVRRALLEAPGFGRGAGPLAHWVGARSVDSRGKTKEPS